MRKKLGKGVLLSQETNETRAISCYCLLRQTGTLVGPLLLKQRKERATAGQYGLNFRGYTRPTMRRTMGCNTVR